MTREKALQAMDKLVAMGYHVVLSEYDTPNHVFVGHDGEMTSLHRWLEIKDLRVDKVDLRALVAFADELGLDVGISALQAGVLSFTDQPTEEEQRKRAVVGSRRRHPR